MGRVSVCVPTFKRPGMLLELVATFLNQDYEDRELRITDDSRDNATERALERFLRDPRIRYQRNPSTLGFAANLYQALVTSTGEIIVVLGDDDLLASKDALTTYAEAFARNQSAAFAYPNLIQVDEELSSTLVYPFFTETVVFPAGRSALQRLFLRSVLITGMAFSRRDLVERFYPQSSVLFPQVAMVGRLLAEADGLGIAEYLVATRAHQNQLGFRAMTGMNVRAEEQHGVIEISEAWDELVASYPELGQLTANIQRQLAAAYLTNMPNEKVYGGNRSLAHNFAALRQRNSVAGRDLRLWALYVILLLLPRTIARKVKNGIRSMVNRRKIGRLEPSVVSNLQSLRRLAVPP